MAKALDSGDLQEVFRVMPESPAPRPWRCIRLHVEGVTAVGFAAGSELLLVLSHSGRDVVDCATGETLAVCFDDGDDADPYPITSSGIGPIEGQEIRLAGLWGGGLRLMTRDGWVVHRAAPNWPSECVVLCPPHAPELLDDPSAATILLKDADVPVRAVGFSDSGRSLVIATTELYVWSRGEDVEDPDQPGGGREGRS